MAKDFRASQIQTTQIISSGSSGTNAKIVVYPVEKQSTSSPNQGVIDPAKFSTGSIGNDIFLYVSGGIGERNLASGSITVFGGDVHISGNLTSDQQQFENLFRLGLVDYATTIQTSSNPEIVGQVIFPADEFSGSLTLRAILASTEVSGVSTIKLFNISSSSYVDIAGPSQQELAVTGTTPTQVESVDLFTAAGFNTTASNFYELQCFSSADSNTALVGGAELRPSGTFTAQTIITSSNIFISGTWIDGGGKLRTTASVAVDGAGGFADNVGSDVYFFVSGTFGSGSSGDAVSVFGGDVRISGTLAVGTSSIFIDNDSISFTTPSANLAYSSSFVLAPFSASQNSSIAGVRIYGGDGGGSATSQRDGGYVEIYTGTGSNSVNPVQAGHGGAFRVVGGKGGNSGTGFGGDGGNIIFTAGSGGNSTNTSGGEGGGFQFIGGAGGSGLGTEHGGSFTFVGGHRGSTSNARGGGFTFRMGNGSSLSNNNSRDGDFIVSGAGNFGSRVSLESVQKISIGLASGVTSTSTGSDTWVYVSGAVNGKGTSAGRMVTYGGSVHISGNLTVDGTAPGGSLQEAYLAGDTITVNSLTGSVTITGDASPSASLRVAATDVNETAVEVMNASNTLDLIRLFGNDSNFGGAAMLLRSNGSFPSYIGWQENSTTPMSKGSSTPAQIYFHGGNNALTLTTDGNQEIWLADGGAFGGNLAVFDPATATGGGQVYLLPNKVNGIVYNSGSMIMRGTASIGTTNTHGTDISMVVTGVVGGKNTVGSSTALFLGDVHVSGNLSVDGTAPGGNNIWQSTTNELTFNTGSIEITGSALIKNTILVLSEGLSLSGGLTSFSSPSGVIGLPYQGFIRTQLHPSDNGTWRTVIGYGDLNGIGIPIENVLYLGDGSSAGNGWVNWSDENLFLALNTTGSAFLTPNGFTIAGADLGFASSKGSDVFFWVSGARDSINSTVDGVSVFGGDVYVSGNMVVGPTLFLSQGLTEPNQPITTQASGTFAIPYGGRMLARRFDNAAWMNVIRVTADPLGSGRENCLLLGDGNIEKNAISAGSAVLILDELTGSVWQSPEGLTIQGNGLNGATTYGQDVYFYVSGTITSGSSTDAISVFGGSVRVSGTLAVGSSSLFIRDGLVSSSGSLELNTFVLTGSAPDFRIQAGNAPHADAAGGNIIIRTGHAGERTSGKRGAGSLTVTLGSGSYSTSVAGDTGGAFSLTSGDGGAAAGSATFAGNAGGINFAGGNGGAGTGTSSTGGIGGGFSFACGTGGASTNAAGGDGGDFQITLGSAGEGAGAVPGEAGTYKVLGGTIADAHFVNSGSVCQIGAETAAGSTQKFRHISFNGVLPGQTGFVGSDIVFYVSGAVSGANASTPGIAVFGGDLHSSGNLIYGHSEDAFNQKIVTLHRTTGSEVGTALTYAVTGSKLYDFDFTIMAVGTGSGITKRFKRNLSVAAFDSPFILENTVFVTVPDVTGSAAADVLDVAFEVSSSNLLVYVSGTTSQSVTWQVRGEITKQSN